MTTTEPARPAAQTPRAAVPLAQMQDALATGAAAPLSQTITDIVRYQSTWWLYDRDGWVPVDNEQLSASLDAAASQMKIADRHVADGGQP